MKLAIVGHRTRGKEVIEILEMLGGKNTSHCCGTLEERAYLVNTFDDIEDRHLLNMPLSKYQAYTLEQFLEKCPYKVGDKVLVKPYVGARQICEMRWDNDDNYMKYGIGVGEWFNVSQLQPYKEQEIMDEGVYAYNEINCYHQDFADKVRIRLGGDYEIKEEEGKTYIVRKKSKYPKTYEECANILYDRASLRNNIGYKGNLLVSLQKLLICRDAYWKIAGVQMGLGEPWKPDWLNVEQDKFVLYTHDNVICLNCFVLGHNVLAFPTSEMRDAFYENFKDLIEVCKELL